MATTPFKWVAGTVYLLSLTSYFVLLSNVLGLRQVVFNGNRPPYHWVVNVREMTTQASFYEDYVDARGKVCGSVYAYPLVMTGFAVYGFGYSEHNMSTRAEAEAVAEKECR